MGRKLLQLRLYITKITRADGALHHCHSRAQPYDLCALKSVLEWPSFEVHSIWKQTRHDRWCFLLWSTWTSRTSSHLSVRSLMPQSMLHSSRKWILLEKRKSFWRRRQYHQRGNRQPLKLAWYSYEIRWVLYRNWKNQNHWNQKTDCNHPIANCYWSRSWRSRLRKGNHWCRFWRYLVKLDHPNR